MGKLQHPRVEYAHVCEALRWYPRNVAWSFQRRVPDYSDQLIDHKNQSNDWRLFKHEDSTGNGKNLQEGVSDLLRKHRWQSGRCVDHLWSHLLWILLRKLLGTAWRWAELSGLQEENQKSSGLSLHFYLNWWRHFLQYFDYSDLQLYYAQVKKRKNIV